MVQWLGLHVSNAGSEGLMPNQRARIPYASQPKKNPKLKTEEYCRNLQRIKTLKMVHTKKQHSKH